MTSPFRSIAVTGDRRQGRFVCYPPVDLCIGDRRFVSQKMPLSACFIARGVSDRGYSRGGGDFWLLPGTDRSDPWWSDEDRAWGAEGHGQRQLRIYSGLRHLACGGRDQDKSD